MQEMGTIIVRAAHLVAEAVPLLHKIGANITRLNAIAEEVRRRAEQERASGRSCNRADQRAGRDVQRHDHGDGLRRRRTTSAEVKRIADAMIPRSTASGGRPEARPTGRMPLAAAA